MNINLKKCNQMDKSYFSLQFLLPFKSGVVSRLASPGSLRNLGLQHRYLHLTLPFNEASNGMMSKSRT